MGYASRIREAVATDHTLLRAKHDGARAARAFPSAAGNYVMEKVPVVHWLPKYNPRWLLNDVLAGITVGVLLIPQSLAYAKIATIPGEFGLMSSWLPNFLYFFMGTSKDMSTGPTSLMGLLTAEIIADVTNEGFTPQAIASAVTMSVGIYCLVVGLFRLGFLLQFVSIPVLNGFISATGIVIMLGQIPSLFGVKAGTGTANILHDLFSQIPKFKPATMGIGFGGIVMLVAMQKMGQRWSKKSKAIWLLALGRSAVVLILFTGISYGVNKDIDLENDDPIWELSKVKSSGINAPVMPNTTLVQKVFPRAVAPFLAAAIEHLAIAKGFGRKNNYVIDPAQELVYLGVTNFFNSFFSSMPVGGAMSRTAVNSDTGVKSPMYGFVAGGFVIISIFFLTPALFWIPKATLAAIIVTAVWHVILPPKVFYGYWKTSLVDFIAAMLSFWVTLFVNTETGIGSAVGFNIVYHILYLAFSRVRQVTKMGDRKPASLYASYDGVQGVPADAQVFQPNQSIIFSNAYHVKGACFDVVQTYNSGAVVAYEAQQKERNWSVSGERRMALLRRRAGINDEPLPIAVVVLDLTMVATIDTTGLTALQDLRTDITKFGGEHAELRFVGVQPGVKAKFERFGWELYDAENVPVDMRAQSKGSAVYGSVLEAVSDRAERSVDQGVGPEFVTVGDEKA
ncbi:sulfate permease [Corynespora cassiicola Philippines]|uniref:Sulfate permease n=1 Tax=Corynespora cassiicola Philippines TaxID=1448308 RepID=A0A2T2N8B2_CORCC|nr:sulfate permease [Corynespora cassiicola Philippines]